jgi:hypothetical protein
MRRTTIGALFTLLALGATACGGDRIAGPSAMEAAPALLSISAEGAPTPVGSPIVDANGNGFVCSRRIVTGGDDGGAMAIAAAPLSIRVDDTGDRCPEGFLRHPLVVV